VTRERVRVVILDEPTSSLDHHAAGQLLGFLRRAVGSGVSFIFVSHLLREILDACDRIVVMRDGQVSAAGRASAFDREKLVTAMGGAGNQAAPPEPATGSARTGAPLLVRALTNRRPGATALTAHAGDIVGLAGLAGHGQTALLRALYAAAAGGREGFTVGAPVALVAGDRQADGVFPQWSVAQNISVRSLERLRIGPLISSEREQALAGFWRDRIGIRAPDLRLGILSLSGGNQQKVLFARALASDARIILMDDPMRGVDVATKAEVYALIRQEARAGRTFLWYTTELEELLHCDPVYVFHYGTIIARLGPHELTEQRLIQSSFGDAG
jgi:ribose transport system ATP-binding protein